MRGLSAICLSALFALVFGACEPEIEGCPDPLMVTFRDAAFFTGYPRSIDIVVLNGGAVDFVSGPGQQEVHLYRNGVLVANEEFPGNRLEVGASFRLTYLEEAAQPGDTLRWRGIIVYDPDIFSDGNSANDDCNLDNNVVEIITF